MKEETIKSSIQKDVFSKKFRDFCKKEFSESMKELEGERLNVLKIRKLVWAICILWILGNLVFSLIMFQSISSPAINNSIFAIVASGIISSLLAKKYKVKAKKLVLSKLLSFVGDFNKMEIDQYKEINKIRELKLFNSFNSWSFDDCIKGKYKELDIEIKEIKLKRVKRNRKRKRTTTIPVFYGLYVKVPSFKKFDSFTIIKPKNESCSHGEKIELEDVEFEKMFNVRGSNQIDARYLITTAFMERIVKLKKKNLIEDISISFENGFIHIGVHSMNKDYFEMDLNMPATEITTYRKIILDLITVLSVINSLKLEQNLGL